MHVTEGIRLIYYKKKMNSIVLDINLSFLRTVHIRHSSEMAPFFMSADKSMHLIFVIKIYEMSTF